MLTFIEALEQLDVSASSIAVDTWQVDGSTYGVIWDRTHLDVLDGEWGDEISRFVSDDLSDITHVLSRDWLVDDWNHYTISGLSGDIVSAERQLDFS